MDTISTRDLRHLASGQPGLCVSIYMTTHPSGVDELQDSLQWKKLLHEVEDGLRSRGLDSSDARAFLAEAHRLPNDMAFWKHRSHGLVAFISPHSFSRYRLAQPFDEFTVIHHRFQIKRLLPLMPDSSPFYVLTLSQNNVRLFKASRFHIEEVDVIGLPANMDEVLNYNGADRGSQVHSAISEDIGKQGAVFHGQGGQSDTRKDDLSQFFRFVNESIHHVLSIDPAPMLLAGVEYLLPIYRDVNSFPQLLRQHIRGNCDYLPPTQLLERAWPLIEPVFHQPQNEAAIKYTELIGTSRASCDLERILVAADEGRVETLFVNPHVSEWGVFHNENASVELHDDRRLGDDDLVEVAIADTLTKNGIVYSSTPGQLPDDPSICAIFRY